MGVTVSPGGAMVAGLAAILLGIGLQRFAYAPILPAMIDDGWLSAPAAGQLGAANFAGYLIGGLSAPWVLARLGVRRSLRLAMVLATLCFALCAIRGDLAWFLPWRTLAGFAGGVLMIAAGPAVQAAVRPQQRPLAAGVTFAGAGGGIVVGALLVPALLPWGLSATWLALALAGLVLTVLSWTRWPNPAANTPPAMGRLSQPAIRLVAAYALSAAAATGHMAWWPDFVARGLGFGTNAGSALWLLYGLAAAGGPLLCGRLAARIGTDRTIVVILVLQAAAAAIAIIARDVPLLVLSTIPAAVAAVGFTGVALTRTRELAGAGGPGLWRVCTIFWGAAQTASGFLLAWLYARTGSHAWLFATTCVLALAALPFAWPARGLATKSLATRIANR